MHAIVHPAGIQDRNDGVPLLSTCSGCFRSSTKFLPTADTTDPGLRKILLLT